MLSREHIIRRSAGEDREVRLERAGARARDDAMLGARLWMKLLFIALTVTVLGAFLFLNRAAVVEPRVHLVFSQFERPALLTVLLLTSLASATAALVARAALHALIHRPERTPVAPPDRRAARAPESALAGAASSAT